MVSSERSYDIGCWLWISDRRDLGSNPSHCMWDLLRTKWHSNSSFSPSRPNLVYPPITIMPLTLHTCISFVYHRHCLMQAIYTVVNPAIIHFNQPETRMLQNYESYQIIYEADFSVYLLTIVRICSWWYSVLSICWQLYTRVAVGSVYPLTTEHGCSWWFSVLSANNWTHV